MIYHTGFADTLNEEARTFFDRLLEENLVFKNSKDAANFLNNYNNSGFQNGGILKKLNKLEKYLLTIMSANTKMV